ncbi:MAG: hypothetical protein VX498_14640 [Myxococcota bacterium]|nr:hypothetical protein [Myxococcota bacterium]
MFLTVQRASKTAALRAPVIRGLWFLHLALGLILLLGAGCGDTESDKVSPLPEIQLSAEDALEWDAFLQPTEEELAWHSINWRTSIWDAVVEATDTGRPLMLFAMNGHPKGFT